MSQHQIAADIAEGVEPTQPGFFQGADMRWSFLNIVMDGVTMLRLTEDQAMGKMQISDELILEIGKRRPRFQLAMVGLMSMTDQTKTETFRETINVLLNEFTNGLHEYIAQEVAPDHYQKVKAEQPA